MLRSFVVFILMFLQSVCAAKADLYLISDPVFSADVRDDYSPVAPTIQPGEESKVSRSLLPRGEIYLSFTVVGSRATIDYIDSNDGELEVLAVVYADGFGEKTRNVGISRDNWRRNRKKLLDETVRTGVFTWRTDVSTQLISNKYIEIRIKDARGNTVKPIGFLGSSYGATINFVP